MPMTICNQVGTEPFFSLLECATCVCFVVPTSHTENSSSMRLLISKHDFVDMFPTAIIGDIIEINGNADTTGFSNMLQSIVFKAMSIKVIVERQAVRAASLATNKVPSQCHYSMTFRSKTC